MELYVSLPLWHRNQVENTQTLFFPSGKIVKLQRDQHGHWRVDAKLYCHLYIAYRKKKKQTNKTKNKNKKQKKKHEMCYSRANVIHLKLTVDSHAHLFNGLSYTYLFKWIIILVKYRE